MFQKCRFLFIYLPIFIQDLPLLQKKADINGGSDKLEIKYMNTDMRIQPNMKCREILENVL